MFQIRLLKFLTTFFSHLFQISHFFASLDKYHENSVLGFPPVVHHPTVTTLFSSFFIYLHFSRKLVPWIPQRMTRWPAPSHHPHPHWGPSACHWWKYPALGCLARKVLHFEFYPAVITIICSDIHDVLSLTVCNSDQFADIIWTISTTGGLIASFSSSTVAGALTTNKV